MSQNHNFPIDSEKAAAYKAFGNKLNVIVDPSWKDEKTGETYSVEAKDVAGRQVVEQAKAIVFALDPEARNTYKNLKWASGPGPKPTIADKRKATEYLFKRLVELTVNIPNF